MRSRNIAKRVVRQALVRHFLSKSLRDEIELSITEELDKLNQLPEARVQMQKHIDEHVDTILHNLQAFVMRKLWTDSHGT